MIEKPIAFYDAVRRQNYFQWPKGKYYIYQEPIYDRTKEYIEALEAENAKLRKVAAEALCYINHPADSSWTHEKRKEVRNSLNDHMRELGIGMGE